MTVPYRAMSINQAKYFARRGMISLAGKGFKAIKMVAMMALKVIAPSVTRRCGEKPVRALSKLKVTIHHKNIRYRS
jgi:hypothetical protein